MKPDKSCPSSFVTQFSDCTLLLQNGMQLPHVWALTGSRNCTEGSNPSRSATQSEVQRNPPGLLLKLREMGQHERQRDEDNPQVFDDAPGDVPGVCGDLVAWVK